MKSIFTYAAIFGLTGGILQSLCLTVGWALYPRGQDIYSTVIGLFVSQAVFVTPICMTKGAAEKSISLLKKGLVIGVVASALSASAFLALVYFQNRLSVFVQYRIDAIVITAMS